ncbi:MAG TPA: PAS domain S-box protein [Anaeromyxobacteraceae bacterium]|nr:PAS domain S-box protein [Anaeromyxobacteraceae bacterium]
MPWGPPRGAPPRRPRGQRTTRISDLAKVGGPRSLLSSSGGGAPRPTPTAAWIEHQIVADAADAILYAERDGVIRYWNAGAERVFGFSAAEAIGRNLDVIVPERLRDRHWKGWDHVLETGVSRYGAGETLSVPATRKDGSTVSVDFTIVVLRDEAGKILGFGAILRDVTARFEREKALGKRLKELQEKLAAAKG